MASSTSTRIWRVAKAAGRPFPTLVEDDVLDYLITEAVFLKASQENQKMEEEHQDAQNRAAWKKEQIAELNKYRGGV